MEMYEMLMKRRSVRNFKQQQIPESLIVKLIDAANNAPTGGNIQPMSLILVQAPEKREELSQIVGNQPWVKNAPLSIIFCIDFWRLKKWASMLDTDFRGENTLSHCLIAFADIMCAAQSVVLLAEDQGLGSVYIGTVLANIDKTRAAFKIPRLVLPVMVLSLGYPKTIPSEIPKLEPEVMVHRDRYRELTDDQIKDAFEDKYGSMEENVDKYLKRTYVEVIEADKQHHEQRTAAIKEQIKKLEIRNNAQFLFKLRYPTEAMLRINDVIMDSFNNAGFGFFKKE